MAKKENLEVAVDAALEDPQAFDDILAQRGSVQRYGDFKPGDNLYVRAVTFHTIGTLQRIDGEKLIISPAVYVRDTQSWFDSLRQGQVECSAFPEECWPVQIHRQAIVDCFRWPHDVKNLLGK